VVSGFCGYDLENVDMSIATREMRWHVDHGERVPRDLCAGCRRPIAAHQPALDLADDNRVHLDNDYRCLIRHGERWRRAAREVIARFDHGPRGVIPDLPPASRTAEGTGATRTLATDQPAKPRPCPDVE
jgi:hypothetical protein